MATADTSSGPGDHEPGGRYGYRLGHTDGHYTIPDVLLHVNDRPLKVITIGAGLSGILMAYLIQKQTQNVELTVYEKNGDIGGTWLENRYPGCACDVPSHAYAYAFALNPEWPAYLSSSGDIFRYLNRVVECFGLREYMQFNSSVAECMWNEEQSKWHVKVLDSVTGEVKVNDTCDILIGAQGILNSYKWPTEVEGLDQFKGRLVHTARWPEDFNEEQWKNQRVAVLGSGASSLQTVPTMQPHVKEMHVFVRTPVWFTQIAGHDGENKDYTPEQLKTFAVSDKDLVAHAKSIEEQLNNGHYFKVNYIHSAEARMARGFLTDKMRDVMKKDEIFEQMVPEFSVGCRRLTPGNPYMRAIQEPNVQLHRAAIAKVSGNKIITTTGVEVEVDTLVCATGFDVSFKPQWLLQGRDGVSLAEKWKSHPEGYLGLAVPGFPNYYTFGGPAFPISNGSLMASVQYVGQYIIQIIHKMQHAHITSLCVRQDVTDAFNHHAQTWLKGSVWADPKCRSWYKDNETGRVNAIWPGSGLHFCEMVSTPRYEDFDIRYENPHNMWAFMGLGFTKTQMENGDITPYLSVNALEQSFRSFVAPKDEEERLARRAGNVRDLKIHARAEFSQPATANGTTGASASPLNENDTDTTATGSAPPLPSLQSTLEGEINGGGDVIKAAAVESLPEPQNVDLEAVTHQTDTIQS